MDFPACSPRRIQRIVFIANDISSIGGIPSRIRKTQKAAVASREIDYFVFCRRNEGGVDLINCHVFETNEKEMMRLMEIWQASETVFVVSNNILRTFPDSFSQKVATFPIVYFYSGQLAFMVQDSAILQDLDYVKTFRATKLIALSDGDINFQRQLGIHGQTKGFLPVEIRHSGRVEPGASPLVAGYVGRIDFHAKDCEKLLEVAAAMRAVGMPPIKLFTTMNKASPDAAEFFVRMKSMDLEAQFEVTLLCTDLDLIYSQFSVLLLPSKKESFGNVIVEANSYGTPVIAARYAPGPAELIVDGKTGFLLDHYTGKNVVDILSVLTPDRLKDISSAAFDHHRNYSMEAHLEFLERISQEAVEEFDGENKLQVLPVIKASTKVLPVIKASTKEKDKSLLKRLRNKVAMRIGRVAFR